MWDSRHDDLWLWPMPEWFVRFCNRLGGTAVLDVVLLLAVAGVAVGVCGLLGIWNPPWLPLVYVTLLVPAAFVVAMMVSYGVFRQIRGVTPEEKLALEECRKRLDQIWRNFKKLEAGENASCVDCGGRLTLRRADTDAMFVAIVECENGCAPLEFYCSKEISLADGWPAPK